MQAFSMISKSRLVLDCPERLPDYFSFNGFCRLAGVLTRSLPYIAQAIAGAEPTKEAHMITPGVYALQLDMRQRSKPTCYGNINDVCIIHMPAIRYPTVATMRTEPASDACIQILCLQLRRVQFVRPAQRHPPIPPDAQLFFHT